MAALIQHIFERRESILECFDDPLLIGYKSLSDILPGAILRSLSHLEAARLKFLQVLTLLRQANFNLAAVVAVFVPIRRGRSI
jgi:hypothetical protein